MITGQVHVVEEAMRLSRFWEDDLPPLNDEEEETLERIQKAKSRPALTTFRPDSVATRSGPVDTTDLFPLEDDKIRIVEDPFLVKPRQDLIQQKIQRLEQIGPRDQFAPIVAEELQDAVTRYRQSETEVMWPKLWGAISESVDGSIIARGVERAQRLEEITDIEVSAFSRGKPISLDFRSEVSRLFEQERIDIIEFVQPALSPEIVDHILGAKKVITEIEDVGPVIDFP